MSDKPRIIAGRAFLDALEGIGIVEANTIKRVVIDAPYNGPVQIYVEMLGDERLLNVATTLDGIEVTRGDEA